jgi:hypothetical protein
MTCNTGVYICPGNANIFKQPHGSEASDTRTLGERDRVRIRHSHEKKKKKNKVPIFLVINTSNVKKDKKDKKDKKWQ